jgi:hypothetical protein
MYVVGTCDSNPGQVVVPLLVPQVHRTTTRNSELTMGRKGIGQAVSAQDNNQPQK